MDNKILLIPIVIIAIGILYAISYHNSNTQVLSYFCFDNTTVQINNNQITLDDQSCAISFRSAIQGDFGVNEKKIEGTMYRIKLDSSCRLNEGKIRPNNLPEGVQLFQNEDNTLYWCTGFSAGT